MINKSAYQVSVKTSCTGTEDLPLEAAMTESTEYFFFYCTNLPSSSLGLVDVAIGTSSNLLSIKFLFKKRTDMSKLLEGLEGVVCHMNNVLVEVKDQEQRDARLVKVFERIESAELTLNANKCTLSKPSV